MKPLQTLAHCAREYPLLTMVGVYTALYTAGEFIARAMSMMSQFMSSEMRPH